MMTTVAHATPTSLHNHHHLLNSSQETLKQQLQSKLHYFHTQRPYINAIADRLHTFALSHHASSAFSSSSMSFTKSTMSTLSPKVLSKSFPFTSLSASSSSLPSLLMSSSPVHITLPYNTTMSPMESTLNSKKPNAVSNQAPPLRKDPSFSLEHRVLSAPYPLTQPFMTVESNPNAAPYPMLKKSSSSSSFLEWEHTTNESVPFTSMSSSTGSSFQSL